MARQRLGPGGVGSDAIDDTARPRSVRPGGGGAQWGGLEFGLAIRPAD